MSNLILNCSNQRQQRKKFIIHESKYYTRYNIISPYVYDSSGELIYNQYELDMRRKAEILKYNNSTNNVTSKSKWAYLSTYNNNSTLRLCTDISKSISTTSSDVPGPPIMLYLDESVPLYNYKTINSVELQEISYNDYSQTYNIFPNYNITTQNSSPGSFCDIVIVTPDKSEMSFGFSIPISITYTADFNSNITTNKINSIQFYIASAKMDVFYSDSHSGTSSSLYYNIPLTNDDLYVSVANLSVQLNNSVTGKINITQLIGYIYIPPISLKTITQYVYTCNVTVNVGYSEYSSDVSSNAYRTNNGVGNLSNNSVPPATSLTNIQIGSIINIEDPYSIKNNSNLINSNSNCSIQLYQSDLSGIFHILTNVIYNPLVINVD